MFVLTGTVVTLRSGGEVLPRGELYVGDDGLIAAVVPGDAVPAWFDAVDANPFHGGLLSGLRGYA